MRAKSMVLILIALGCGLVASIAISQVIERGANSEAALETVQIYVATTDIDVNDMLDAENVRVEDWPKSKVPEGAVLDFEKIDQQFARVRFYEGEPILQAKLANEIEGPAIKIPEGFRVCSLKVQMDTSVSGLVNPGDRVDIFGYFRKGQDVPRTGTRQILRNVRVFAVNSETEQETDQEGKTIIAKTVSVLVEHDQVAKLMLATELGTLRLALRRPNEILDSTEGDNATVEMLFGSRSENADEDEEKDSKKGSTQLAAAAGKFGQFLAGLQRNNNAGTPALASVAQASGPAWQMVVLTPDGGTNFTWDDETRLPQQGDAASPGLSNPLRSMTPPVNGLRGLSGATPDPLEPQGQGEPEEEEEQDQGADNQDMGDD